MELQVRKAKLEKALAENWKPLPGYEGYFVSDKGRVMSTYKGKFL